MKRDIIFLIVLIFSIYACNDSSGHSISKCDGDDCKTTVEPSDPNIDPEPDDLQDVVHPQDDPQTPQPDPEDSQTTDPKPEDPQTTDPKPADPQTTDPKPEDPTQTDPKPHPIDPIPTDEPCTQINETRCHNDGWHGFTERCINGFWHKEQTCGEYSCMNEKECGECLGGTRTCENKIMTWCQNGKRYQKQCNRCLDSGNICEYFDHEPFCQELTPGFGIEYIGDVWYTPYVCEGPCSEDGKSCAWGYHCKEGESYCYDDGYIIGNGASDIKQMTCKNGQWEYERCILGCNADHTACKPVDNIDDYRCTDNEDGSLRSECYEENGSSFERYCDYGFWSPPRQCKSKCASNHQHCLSISTGGCTEEGKTRCNNDSEKHQYGKVETCINGEWVETQSCGSRSCDGDHCGKCTNYVSTCIDDSEFIYCHQGREFHVSCACDSSSCLSCPDDDHSTFCFDRTFWEGILYTCENSELKAQECKTQAGVSSTCNAEGTGCR